MKTPLYIFVHHTAVSYIKNPDQALATDGYHKRKWEENPSSLGFYGAYNAEVALSGKLTTFRADGEANKYAQYIEKTSDKFPKVIDGYLNNGIALSICMDGNFDIEEPSLEQCNTVYKWIKSKMEKYNIPRENVMPHRAVQYKTCCGSKIPDDVLGYLEKRLGFNEPPEWALEALDAAKAIGIDQLENLYEDITPEKLEWIFHDIGVREDMSRSMSLLDTIVCLYKAGAIPKKQ